MKALSRPRFTWGLLPVFFFLAWLGISLAGASALEARSRETRNAWFDLSGSPCPFPVSIRVSSDTKPAANGRRQKSAVQTDPAGGSSTIVSLFVDEAWQSLLQGVLQKAPVSPFRAFTRGGALFYERGQCRTGTLLQPDGAAVGFTWVPQRIDGKPNPAFPGDLGLLVLTASGTPAASDAASMVQAAFQPGTVRPISPEAMNSRFPHAYSDLGVPHLFVSPGFSLPLEAFVLPPVHKLSVNKRLTDPRRKLEADLLSLQGLLAPGEGLLSQRERLRRGLVPDSVKLDWKRIDETDLGSGQNQFIFLTMGPGINYFDGPWGRQTATVPGPRFIIDPTVLRFADLQFFPTYSIDPLEAGEGRHRAINDFQTGGATPMECRSIVFMPFSRRLAFISTLGEALCRYGLLNDDPALERGFSLMGRTFRGNVVNNEIRVVDGLSLREWAIGVIVAPGTGERCRRLLRDLGFDDRAGPGGIPLREFVIEAPSPDDKGFRRAYLGVVLRCSGSVLAETVDRLRQGNPPKPGYALTLEAIDRLIRREGLSFLDTPRARRAARRWAAGHAPAREENP